MNKESNQQVDTFPISLTWLYMIYFEQLERLDNDQ